MNKPTFEEYLKFSLEELKFSMEEEIKATDKITGALDVLDVFDLCWNIEDKYNCDINDDLVGDPETYIGKPVQELIQDLYHATNFAN